MTSEALSKFTENTRLWLVFFIQNLTRFVTLLLWFQNSIPGDPKKVLLFDQEQSAQQKKDFQNSNSFELPIS